MNSLSFYTSCSFNIRSRDVLCTSWFFAWVSFTHSLLFVVNIRWAWANFISRLSSFCDIWFYILTSSADIVSTSLTSQSRRDFIDSFSCIWKLKVMWPTEMARSIHTAFSQLTISSSSLTVMIWGHQPLDEDFDVLMIQSQLVEFNVLWDKSRLCYRVFLALSIW